MKNTVKILALLLALAVPGVSFAYWGAEVDVNVGRPDYKHYYRYHDRPRYGWHVHYLPPRHPVVWVNGTQYHYYDGLYYTYVRPGDYVLVTPPMGVSVPFIPAGFRQVVINGRVYYTDNGIWYVRTRHHGYKIVPPPVAWRGR